jgi:glycosyltransferase involved in cell wall biosynthesis
VTREKVSVTIITHNEEDNIEACLRSVAWADEIVVVDSGSTDRTVEICRRFTDKIYFNTWEGMKEQKNFAVGKTTHPWILSIDADERVTEELRAFTLTELEHPAFDGYRFRRMNFFLGRWLRHGGWYPDHVLRLFRKDTSYFDGINPHDRVIVKTGNVATTSLHLEHFTYKSLAQYILKQNLYSSISAAEKFKTGKFVRMGVTRAVLKTIWKFVETYILKAGFLDGFYGFVVSAGATYATFWKYAKIRELIDKAAAARKAGG